MAKAKGKIRIKDIAERAGISIGTVDRVLHNRGEVKEETRRKVMAIVDEMGYTPNLMAKSLASKKPMHLAVLIPDASDNNPYWEHPKAGIVRAADEIKNFNTSVEIFSFNATDEFSFQECFKKVIDSNPDGVVFDPLFKEASIDYVEIMDARGIPYVYIDTELEKGNFLAHFGQNAEQGGRVAAKIMSNSLPEEAEILIVNLANRKVISHHLQKREEGFKDFFRESNLCKCKLHSLDIDLLDVNEPAKSLDEALKGTPEIKGIFVPNSRVYEVAAYLKERGLADILCLGFDLIKENIKYMEDGIIDFVIAQRPEEQGYRGVMALFNHIMLNKEVNKSNYSPIDIIIKENINYYNY